tara:strand:+ start:351 stop:542 length:192 start_codon:yes stop_codon:yes gene_type:complete
MWLQMFWAKSGTQGGIARSRPDGVENENFSMSRWPSHKYFPRHVWATILVQFLCQAGVDFDRW